MHKHSEDHYVLPYLRTLPNLSDDKHIYSRIYPDDRVLSQLPELSWVVFVENTSGSWFFVNNACCSRVLLPFKRNIRSQYLR